MFDDRLKRLRTEKNLSMRQVALALKMPYTTYVSYEKNKREPNSETLINLADFFECSIDYLVGHSDQVKMLTLDDKSFNLSLSAHEKDVITAYKEKSEMQPAVDKLLGIDKTEIVSLTAARSKNNENSINEEKVQDLSKFEPDELDF